LNFLFLLKYKYIFISSLYINNYYNLYFKSLCSKYLLHNDLKLNNNKGLCFRVFDEIKSDFVNLELINFGLINYFITCKYNLIQYFFFTKNVIEEFYNCYLIVNKLLKEKNVLKYSKKILFLYLNSNYIQYSFLEYKCFINNFYDNKRLEK